MNLAPSLLPLDSPRWGELQHVYGAAGDIPPLLEEIYRDPTRICSYDEEPWEPLWSSLCHQGDVYPASFAAAPHLIEAAVQCAEKGLLFTWDCIALPVEIEWARMKQGDMPADESYFTQLRRINGLLAFLDGREISEDYRQIIRRAKRILKAAKLLEAQ